MAGLIARATIGGRSEDSVYHVYRQGIRRPLGCERLLVEAAADHDSRVGLVASALQIQPLVAHRDLVAVQKPHALEAARGAGRGVVLWQGEDHGRGRSDKVEEGGADLAIGLGIELARIVAAAAAQRQ